MMEFIPPFQSLQWHGHHLTILDQTALPEQELYRDLKTHREVWEAIRKLRVRGAPAIGIAGAYGFLLGIDKISDDSDFRTFFAECDRIAEYLNSARPTAVNLSWALKRLMATLYDEKEKPVSELKILAEQTAVSIHEEDRKLCRSIGQHGVELIPEKARILTHCNTGGLATGEFGTALSVILHAHHAGRVQNVRVNETRPLLQGARLTTWELEKAEIPFTLNVDSAAAVLMQKGDVDLVIAGADRISRNGDTANKIGTYMLAVLAKEHNIPFYIAAPYSTIDMSLDSGKEIVIEERDPEEVTHFGARQTAPENAPVFNPAFDVTPHHLITAIITEKGVIRPDYETHFSEMFS
jgi:methylthioribose-1-phosphate isomerase